MIRFLTWTVQGDIYTASMSIYGVTDVFNARWNKVTGQLETSVALDADTCVDVRSAFSHVCVRYEGKKLKLGKPTTVAWG